jgi:hypothetical protein
MSSFICILCQAVLKFTSNVSNKRRFLGDHINEFHPEYSVNGLSKMETIETRTAHLIAISLINDPNWEEANDPILSDDLSSVDRKFVSPNK